MRAQALDDIQHYQHGRRHLLFYALKRLQDYDTGMVGIWALGLSAFGL
jgi:hypothetical protein